MATKKPTPAPAAEPAMPFDKMVRIYKKIAAKITETKAEYDKALEELEAQKDVLTGAIRDHMQEQNATSINTPFGTAIMSKQTRYNTNDWDGFKTFVKEHDALDLFERRIAQKNMSEFRTANPDLLPPGLSSDSKLVITVRKPAIKSATK
jgi:hypothetical protein